MSDSPLPFSLDRCTISGYRAINGSRFDFSQISLIVGVNGAGKTSVLQAVSFLLEDIARRIGTTTVPGQKPTAFDFRHSFIRIQAEVSSQDEVVSVSRTWKVVDSTVSESVKIGAPILARKYWISIENGENIELPLLCFYPISRAVADVPLRIRKERPASRRDAYERAFTAERHFQSFFQWFREEEDVENETHRRNPHLNAVRTAIELAMPGYRNLRVSRRPRLQMLIDKDDQILSIQQLSDGEQGVLTLIGDLARRASILNPHLKDPLQSPGCILVDEIDQHLHPQWQRHVIQTLRRIFPKMQFILTSHSPIVCGSVEPDSLIILKNGRAESGSVYGWSMAAILKAVFDVDERPPAIHADLVALDRAIDEGNLMEARSLVDSLLNVLPPDDPEIVRANVILPVLEEANRAS